MDKKIFRVYLQLQGEDLHPISGKLVTTVRALGAGYQTQGVIFTDRLSGTDSLKRTGLDEILVLEGPAFAGFLPEVQAKHLAGLEPAEIFLFPATPEGRTLSAMTAALLHTGVTADCTALSFREDGRLLQTRPAFSGSRMADIVTDTLPQMASLRFGMPVPEPEGRTEIVRRLCPEAPDYPVRWIDRTARKDVACQILLAVGGGVDRKEDLDLFQQLAEKLGGELRCSRALVERGWMPRSAQIGLSGGTVSARYLIAFGISGSVQFQAGLGEIGHLIAVDRNPDTPLMARADLPIQGDLKEIGGEMLKNL